MMLAIVILAFISQASGAFLDTTLNFYNYQGNTQCEGGTFTGTKYFLDEATNLTGCHTNLFFNPSTLIFESRRGYAIRAGPCTQNECGIQQYDDTAVTSCLDTGANCCTGPRTSHTLQLQLCVIGNTTNTTDGDGNSHHWEFGASQGTIQTNEVQWQITYDETDCSVPNLRVPSAAVRVVPGSCQRINATSSWKLNYCIPVDTNNPIFNTRLGEVVYYFTVPDCSSQSNTTYRVISGESTDQFVKNFPTFDTQLDAAICNPTGGGSVKVYCSSGSFVFPSILMMLLALLGVLSVL